MSKIGLRLCTVLLRHPKRLDRIEVSPTRLQADVFQGLVAQVLQRGPRVMALPAKEVDGNQIGKARNVWLEDGHGILPSPAPHVRQ